jgi:hypothetical protein
MTLEQILAKLEGVRGSAGQYTARCPAHDDTNASLSISQADDGRILVKCFAGCTFQNIVNALGLSESDFFPKNDKRNGRRSSKGGGVAVGGVTLEQLAEYKKLPVEFLTRLGLKDLYYQGNPAVCVAYYDDNNQVLTFQFRVSLSGRR